MNRWTLSAIGIGIGFTPLRGSGATLSLQGPDQAATINLLPGESATIQIVLELAEAESFGFVNLFPQATVVEGSDDSVEVLDFGPAPGVLEDAFRDTTFLPEGRPYAIGEGIPPGEYHLILSTEPIGGPAALILEEVRIHANVLGTVEVAFQEGLLAPGVFDAEGISYGVAPVGLDPVPTLLTLGTGDDRDGGAGPLVINVVEEVPADPVDAGANDNGSDPDPNGNDAPDDDEPTPTPGGGQTGLCGAGFLAALTLIGFGLMSLRSRTRH